MISRGASNCSSAAATTSSMVRGCSNAFHRNAAVWLGAMMALPNAPCPSTGIMAASPAISRRTKPGRTRCFRSPLRASGFVFWSIPSLWACLTLRQQRGIRPFPRLPFYKSRYNHISCINQDITKNFSQHLGFCLLLPINKYHLLIMDPPFVHHFPFSGPESSPAAGGRPG